MKQLLKKCTCIMLVVLLCLSVPTAGFAGIGVPSVSAEAAELVDSGTFGDNITWTLDSNGLLTISGTGEMPSAYEAGWHQYYDNIYSVVVEEGITSLSDYAFDCFYSLTEVTLPDGLERIGESAFGYCESLATLVLPDSVTVIGNDVFNGCTALRELTVPAGVTEIGYNAFYSCSALESITIAEGNADYQSADGVLYNADMSKLILYPAQKTGTAFTVPETVTYIEDYAFAYNTYLTAVSIPDCVSYVGIGAFSSCSALTEVNIPADMQILGANTFNGCTSLESFTVPAHITSIDNAAFCGCESLMQLTILNPSCNIWWGEEECTYPANVTVYGYDGSTAQIGAEANNLTFVSLGTAPEDPTDPEEPEEPTVPEYPVDPPDRPGIPTDGPTLEDGRIGLQTNWTVREDNTVAIEVYLDDCYLMTQASFVIEVDSIGLGGVAIYEYGTDALTICDTDNSVNFSLGQVDAGEIDGQVAFNEYLYGVLDWEAMGLQVNTDHFHVATLYLTVSDESAFATTECTLAVNGTVDYVTEEQYSFSTEITKPAQVDPGAYFSVESTGLKDADGIVEVDIYLHDFAGLSAFNFYLDIDETLFSYAGLEAGADALAVNTAMPNEIYLECNQHDGQVELGGCFTHCLYSAEHYNNASIHADRFHLATVLLQADENAEELQINATSKVDFEGFEADGFTYPAIGMVKNKTASCTVAMSCDHNYQFVKVITPATCVQQGSDLYVCSVCGDEMTSTVSMDPENHAGLTEIRNAVSATCGKDGYTGDTYCLDCGVKTADGTTVPATGNHTWDNGVQTLAPTYTAPGVKTFTCTVCGATRTEEIAQLESVFEEDEEQVVIIEDVGLVTKAGATVTEFLEKASEGTVIVNAKGEELAEDVLPGTGCVLVLPDGTEHTIVIPGDINGDGEILSSDARKALRSAVGLENLQGAYSTAADVDATDGIAVADARKILRASVHLDDPDEWFDVFKSNTAA